MGLWGNETWFLELNHSRVRYFTTGPQQDISTITGPKGCYLLGRKAKRAKREANWPWDFLKSCDASKSLAIYWTPLFTMTFSYFETIMRMESFSSQLNTPRPGFCLDLLNEKQQSGVWLPFFMLSAHGHGLFPYRISSKSMNFPSCRYTEQKKWDQSNNPFLQMPRYVWRGPCLGEATRD